jgi:hypothetical protein
MDPGTPGRPANLTSLIPGTAFSPGKPLMYYRGVP